MRHDVFGFPERIGDALDRAVIESTTDSIIAQGTPWFDYVDWRAVIAADHESGDHRCGREDCVWCPLGEGCDEHALPMLRRGAWLDGTKPEFERRVLECLRALIGGGDA